MCLFFLKNDKLSRYRYIPTPRIRTPWMFFNTTKRPSPPGRQKDRFREVRAFASLAELEGAAAVDRQRAQSAWRRKLLMLGKKPLGNGYLKEASPWFSSPNLKGIPYKKLFDFWVSRGYVGKFLDWRGKKPRSSRFGDVFGAFRFFFRNAKKAWEKHEKLLGLMIHKRQIHSGKLRNGGIFYGDWLVTGRYSFLGNQELDANVWVGVR